VRLPTIAPSTSASFANDPAEFIRSFNQLIHDIGLDINACSIRVVDFDRAGASQRTEPYDPIQGIRTRGAIRHGVPVVPVHDQDNVGPLEIFP
jgi:hypothetical protein